ncbi:YceK/YidQ family lipoprotein [Pseudomonas sp. A34-9]|uniref:YceK/YidQ family lipoprotein n=1 Tax=Pseudomonas sp. A34-9 TaxID=3034675 RepID=UPI00240D8DF3|nr:YceK/YidQ family lipoprotein [Pseudomonas sp. A34-9]
MRIQAMMLTAVMLGGCGTVQTVARSDQVAVDDLKKNKSYCGAVPRIYSGVMYDFCNLHAPIGQGNAYNNALPGWAIDAVASGVLDTLLLPYTIYKQQTDGSIVIN